MDCRAFFLVEETKNLTAKHIYLLKPINIDELKIAVNKAIEKHQSKNIHQQLEHLMLLLKTQQQKEQHTIALPTAKEIRLVKVNSIIRCESINNYTVFYFSNGNKITVSKPIFEYDDILKDYGFIRCHQSHLINKKMVRSWMKEDGGYILLNDGTNIPVSRQKKRNGKTSNQHQLKKWICKPKVTPLCFGRPHTLIIRYL